MHRCLFLLLGFIVLQGCKTNIAPLEDKQTGGLYLDGSYNSMPFQYRDLKPVISVIIDSSGDKLKGVYISDISFIDLIKKEASHYVLMLELNYNVETKSMVQIGSQ